MHARNINRQDRPQHPERCHAPSHPQQESTMNRMRTSLIAAVLATAVLLPLALVLPLGKAGATPGSGVSSSISARAEAARVPFADVGPIKIENGFSDEQVLFLSDIFPTGYMGADMCDIERGDVVAVWGAGPVGQFAIASAKLLGAERVIAIDQIDYRLRMALEKAGADETINFKQQPDVVEQLKEMTAGRGPDKCIDAVGMEAEHGHLPIHAYDRVKQAARLETERPHALREAVLACRSGGILSVIGVYGGVIDKFPMGAVMNRSLTIKSGQCHVQRYLKPLLARIADGEIDPSFVVTHRMELGKAPEGYETFKHKRDECVKVVLKPWRCCTRT